MHYLRPPPLLLLLPPELLLLLLLLEERDELLTDEDLDELLELLVGVEIVDDLVLVVLLGV